jgi:uncharacterized membrane protein
VLLAFFHTMAIAVYLGGTVFLGAVLIPVLRWRGLDATGLRIMAAVIRVFHPVSLASLGLLVLTGAVALTPLKETLGPGYVSRLFGVLAVKLLLVFVLILSSSYQFFVLGPRLVRALPAEGEKPGGETSAEAVQLVRRLQRWALSAAALGAAIVYVSLRMGRTGS